MALPKSCAQSLIVYFIALRNRSQASLLLLAFFTHTQAKFHWAIANGATVNLISNPIQPRIYLMS